MIVDKIALWLVPIKRRLGIDGPVGDALRQIRRMTWKLELRLRTRAQFRDRFEAGLLSADPRAILRAIDPSTIDKFTDAGTVVGGSWDTETTRFEELDIYRAFQARFRDGTRWEETEFFRRVVAEIDSGATKWSCTNRAQLLDRCASLDLLYHDIRERGYLDQAALGNRDSIIDPYDGADEVTVCIARNGELLFEDGRHRLSIAKLLALPEIPIRVTVRHPEWARFRAEVVSFVQASGGASYQPLLHADLSHIPSKFGPERFDWIAEAIGIRAGSLYDLGAQWGYFSQRFEKLGFHCTALESDPTALYFLKKLRDAAGASFEVEEGSILDRKEPIRADVVLALNLFHHFLKEESSYRALLDLLQKMEVRFLVLQVPEDDSPQMKDAYEPLTGRELAEHIRTTVGLATRSILGTTEDGREVILLSNVG